MAGARNAVKILPGTRCIHKWPTSFTKTNVEARKYRAVLLDSHLTAMLESSSFGHHCFLHRNNPAWLLTASAKATDYPNSGPRFRKRHGSFNTFFSGGTDILQYLDAQTEQNPQLCEGIYCDSMTLHSKHLPPNPTSPSVSKIAGRATCPGLHPGSPSPPRAASCRWSSRIVLRSARRWARPGGQGLFVSEVFFKTPLDQATVGVF